MIKPVFQSEIINITFKIHSFRRYGEPKLPKPKELKGIKQLCSIDYINKKCKCPIFKQNNNVWIKHKDYFSPCLKVKTEDLGKPLNYIATKYIDKNTSKKFLYSDAWGSIVLRQEAWIVIENLIKEIRLNKSPIKIVQEILRQQEKLHNFDKYELCCTDMERFWEALVYQLIKINI